MTGGGQNKILSAVLKPVAGIVNLEKGAGTTTSIYCYNFFRKGENMNKGDLINEVSKVVKTKKDAQAAVDCVLSSITRALAKGDSVSLVGFGTFKVTARKARKGRNPQTGAEINIAASKVPKFVAGKALKDAVK
jgi:DNA-binding protein HU-beta